MPKGFPLGCERTPLAVRKDSFRSLKGLLPQSERTSSARRVGLFGGSFNPIHNGHIAVARAALGTKRVDEVWLMVSPQNPFKRDMRLLDDVKRLEMVRAAVEDEPQMEACDYEFRLPRPSYTWHTLQALERDCPGTEFSLIIGGDNWAKFSQWFHAADILSRYTIMVYPRSGSAFNAASLPPNVTLLDVPLHDISSTDIRERLLRGEDVSALMPPQAADMARRHYCQ